MKTISLCPGRGYEKVFFLFWSVLRYIVSPKSVRQGQDEDAGMVQVQQRSESRREEGSEPFMGNIKPVPCRFKQLYR